MKYHTTRPPPPSNSNPPRPAMRSAASTNNPARLPLRRRGRSGEGRSSKVKGLSLFGGRLVVVGVGFLMAERFGLVEAGAATTSTGLVSAVVTSGTESLFGGVAGVGAEESALESPRGTNSVN